MKTLLTILIALTIGANANITTDMATCDTLQSMSMKSWDAAMDTFTKSPTTGKSIYSPAGVVLLETGLNAAAEAYVLCGAYDAGVASNLHLMVDVVAQAYTQQ